MRQIWRQKRTGGVLVDERPVDDGGRGVVHRRNDVLETISQQLRAFDLLLRHLFIDK